MQKDYKTYNCGNKPPWVIKVNGACIRASQDQQRTIKYNVARLCPLYASHVNYRVELKWPEQFRELNDVVTVEQLTNHK